MTRQGLNRRDFLIASAGTSLAAFGPVPGKPITEGSGAPVSPNPDLAYLVGLLKEPPPETRPRTRWWWFGGAVTQKEISRELEIMHQAGLGGVEIQPVYPVATDDIEHGIRHLSYFSAEWFDRLKHAVVEARRLGLEIDLTLGSGWPFGGPFVPLELAARRLNTLSRYVQGPAHFTWDLQSDLGEGERVAAFVAVPQTEGGQLDPSRAVVLDSSSEKRDSVDPWNIERGAWRVFAFIDAPTYMMVKRPTLGMEGYVIDHFSRKAVQLFLRAAGDRVLRELNSLEGSFDAVFCDSLEVYGADWTPQFLEEFRKRRGYDLAPHLPSLVETLDERTPRVRYDYHLTLSELTLNNFFVPLARWAHENGLGSRVQAHGAMGDILEAYGTIDVPEGEMFGQGDKYGVNVRHRRLASSAGHIYKKTVISAETYTWLRMPMFLVTLEMMKAATDAMFMDGINQIVNHGYPYSPPERGRPGWNFYASTLINHNATWWRHYPELSRYIQRSTALLQRGRPINRVAVLIPLADIFSSRGHGGFHLDEEIEKQLGEGLLNGLRYSGYDFDLINEKALMERTAVSKGRLRVGVGEYEAVMIPSCRYLSVGALERLIEFVRGGGLLIFAGQVPSQSPGLVQFEQSSRQLKDQVRQLVGARPTPGEIRGIDQGRVVWFKEVDALLAGLSDLLEPDFEILSSDDGSIEDVSRNVGFVRRRLGATDFYFVANISADPKSLRVRFDLGHRKPVRLNPETGEVVKGLAYSFSGSGHSRLATDVRLFLGPFGSCFLVFGVKTDPVITETNFPGILEQRTSRRFRLYISENEAYWMRDSRGRQVDVPTGRLPAEFVLEKNWKLTVERGEAIELEQLVPWSELEELQGYSGWASYETEFQFEVADPDLLWFLDLGRVNETAEVILNGENLGACWKRPRRLDCGAALRPGRNHLRIEVANLWIHRVLASPPPDYSELEQSYGIRWGRYGEVSPQQIPPSGLLGPVRLRPIRPVEIRF